MKKDIVIKIILLVLVVTVISSTLTSLVVTNTLSTNKILGSVSYSDYLDSSNVTYLNSNVQDSIDNLYTQANDYSKLSSVIGSSNLTTNSNNLSGAVNELNTNIVNLKEQKVLYDGDVTSEIYLNEKISNFMFISIGVGWLDSYNITVVRVIPSSIWLHNYPDTMYFKLNDFSDNDTYVTLAERNIDSVVAITSNSNIKIKILGIARIDNQ